LLLTAHHQDDQAETLLLALLRGSGVQGLAAMPFSARLGRGRLLRPLLDQPRAALVRYAEGAGLSWRDDPTNESQRLDRNYLRHSVMPVLRARWPAVGATCARSAAHCAEAAGLIDRIASEQVAHCAGRLPGTLDVLRLRQLDRPTRKVVVRDWLRGRGFPTPGASQVRRILDEMLPCSRDRDPLVTWAGCEVRRYRNDLFALVPLPVRPETTRLIWKGARDGTPFWLPAPLGELRWPALADAADDLGAALGVVSIRFGCSGLSCRERQGGSRRPLKKRLQEAGVPRWLRPYVPTVWAGETLLGVTGVCACAGDVPAVSRVGLPQWLHHPWADWGLFV
jgi:tRNA(Ile)-lysidine synthase